MRMFRSRELSLGWMESFTTFFYGENSIPNIQVGYDLHTWGVQVEGRSGSIYIQLLCLYLSWWW